MAEEAGGIEAQNKDGGHENHQGHSHSGNHHGHNHGCHGEHHGHSHGGHGEHHGHSHGVHGEHQGHSHGGHGEHHGHSHSGKGHGHSHVGFKEHVGDDCEGCTCGVSHEESECSDSECSGHCHSHALGRGHAHGLAKSTDSIEGSKLQTANSMKSMKSAVRSRTVVRSRTSWMSIFSAPRSSASGIFFTEELCTACCGHPRTELCAVRGCRAHELVKTRLSVRNICCDAEVRLIKRLLEPLKGVDNVSVNPFSKICAVVHCPVACCSSPEAILETLNDAGLGAALLGQGLASDAADGLWCQQHLRHLSVGLTGLFLILGLAFTALDAVALGFQIAAMAFGMPFIFREVAQSLKKCTVDLSSLVVIAAAGACAQGELLDGALVVWLYNLAKVIEQVAMSRVSRALRAVMQLETLQLVSLAQDGRMVAASELKEGDVIALRPGEECPVDGVVLRGKASCSEAAITGEARPVEKRKEHQMVSGCVILNGYVELKVSRDYANSTLSVIEAKVEEAQMQRTKRQLLLERFARIWTPLVLLTVLIMCTVVPFATGEDVHRWIHRGLVILLTACPCAIVIGAPLATTCAIAACAAKGLLIKKPDTVELLPTIQVAGLDKTGTLSKGEFAVLHVEEFSHAESAPGLDPLKMAAAVEMKSAHPISAAIVSHAVGCVGEAFEHEELPSVSRFKNVAGVGVAGHVAGHQVRIGNARLLSEEQRRCFEAFQQRHPEDTTVAVVVDGALRLALALNDTLRPSAPRLVAELQARHVEAALLTGDGEAAGRHVALATGLDPKACHFSMHPEEKHQWVKKQEDEGRASLMLGDGINDAMALAEATVGVAMGESSAALAASSADAVLMSENLEILPRAMALCLFAKRIEHLNIFLPCLVKLIEVVFALSGHLELWMAIVADLGTLLLVLLLGLTVLSQRFWPSTTYDSEAESTETESV